MLSPESLAASITALAVALAEGKTTDELDLLASIFTQLGDTLATISAAKSKQDTKSLSKQKDDSNC